MIGFSDYKDFEIKTSHKIKSMGLSRSSAYTKYYVDEDLDVHNSITIKDSNHIIFDGQNHTIDIRKGGYLNFKNCNHVKICNLTIVGNPEGCAEGAISLQINTCTHVLIENCTFIDGEDEQLSIKNHSDYITITCCKFIHNSNANHTFSILVGKDREDVPESGKYHVTVHQCYFNGGCGRQPRFRNSIMHLLNCIWDRKCSFYIIGPEKSEIIIDRCFLRSNSTFIGRFGDFTYKIFDSDITMKSRYDKYKDETLQKPNYEYTTLELDELVNQLKITLEPQKDEHRSNPRSNRHHRPISTQAILQK